MIKQISFILILSLLVSACDSKKNFKSITEKEKTESLIQQSKYCFIHDIRKDNLGYILIFNQIEYRNDSDANTNKIIELPNGYYFSDPENKLEKLQIESNVSVIMQTFSFNDDGNFNFNQKVNISELADTFKKAPIVRFKQIPFRVVSTGTKVDSLFEIYIP